MILLDEFTVVDGNGVFVRSALTGTNTDITIKFTAINGNFRSISRSISKFHQTVATIVIDAHSKLNVAVKCNISIFDNETGSLKSNRTGTVKCYICGDG